MTLRGGWARDARRSTKPRRMAGPVYPSDAAALEVVERPRKKPEPEACAMCYARLPAHHDRCSLRLASCGCRVGHTCVHPAVRTAKVIDTVNASDEPERRCNRCGVLPPHDRHFNCPQGGYVRTALRVPAGWELHEGAICPAYVISTERGTHQLRVLMSSEGPIAVRDGDASTNGVLFSNLYAAMLCALGCEIVPAPWLGAGHFDVRDRDGSVRPSTIGDTALCALVERLTAERLTAERAKGEAKAGHEPAAEALAPGWTRHPKWPACFTHASGAWVRRCNDDGHWSFGTEPGPVCVDEGHVWPTTRDEAMARALGWEPTAVNTWRPVGSTAHYPCIFLMYTTKLHTYNAFTGMIHAREAPSLPHAIAMLRGDAA